MSTPRSFGIRQLNPSCPLWACLKLLLNLLIRQDILWLSWVFFADQEDSDLRVWNISIFHFPLSQSGHFLVGYRGLPCLQRGKGQFLVLHSSTNGSEWLPECSERFSWRYGWKFCWSPCIPMELRNKPCHRCNCSCLASPSQWSTWPLSLPRSYDYEGEN